MRNYLLIRLQLHEQEHQPVANHVVLTGAMDVATAPPVSVAPVVAILQAAPHAAMWNRASMIAKLNEPTLDENVLANNGNDVGLGLSWIATVGQQIRARGSRSDHALIDMAAGSGSSPGPRETTATATATAGGPTRVDVTRERCRCVAGSCQLT